MAFYLFVSSIAQAAQNPEELAKQISAAKISDELYIPFEELKDAYFRENKYNDFAGFLKSLDAKKTVLAPFVNYYTALARYHQLKYLEEKHLWDEYFSQGSVYKEEIAARAKEAVDITVAADILHIYSRLLLWQFHKDQQDALSGPALSDLVNSVIAYARASGYIEPIKNIADKISSYGEKARAQEVYKVYAGKIAASDIKDDTVASIALSFYKEGNLELSETIYDIYIERVARGVPAEKAVPILIDIARSFAYKNEGPSDMPYAEKVFKKIEELGGREAFGEDLLYLRAFNLEKAREYQKARDGYIELLKRYPASALAGEADYKTGIIYTYILRDIKSGSGYFEKLAKEEAGGAHAISAAYQLGLLSQWQGDNARAKEHYARLLEKAKGDYPETVNLAKERLKEIEEAKPLEYNLKTFLDVSLKEEYALFDMSRSGLVASPYRLKKGEVGTIAANVYALESGCMQIELQYLWSGQLGKEMPLTNQPSFKAVYLSPGTKEINLIIVSPAGIIDRNIDLVDVY